MAHSQHEENAALEQAAHWNRETLSVNPPPGSAAEEEALATIDFNRDQERVARSDNDPHKRRRRQRRYWRARGLHVDV